MLITVKNFNLQLDIVVLKWVFIIFNLLNVLSHAAVLTGRVIAILTALQSSENAKFIKDLKIPQIHRLFQRLSFFLKHSFSLFCFHLDVF